MKLNVQGQRLAKTGLDLHPQGTPVCVGGVHMDIA